MVSVMAEELNESYAKIQANWSVVPLWMWRSAVRYNLTGVSDEHTDSIFRFEDKPFKHRKKKKYRYFSETSMKFYQTTRRHITEDDTAVTASNPTERIPIFDRVATEKQ
jgi:hypothetical protein